MGVSTNTLQRLLGAVDSSLRLRLQPAAEEELLSGLMSPTSDLRLGAPLAETAERRHAGVAFLPVPGCRTHLRAFCLREEMSTREPPSWSEVISPSGESDNRFLLGEGDLPYYFLRGQCGIPTGRFFLRSMREPQDAVRCLLEETQRHCGSWVIFVSAEETCRRTIAVLERAEGLAARFSVAPLPAGREDYPHYPLAIAFSREEALRRARRFMQAMPAWSENQPATLTSPPRVESPGFGDRAGGPLSAGGG